ncbi:Cell division control protein 15 [Colletotrichum tanaceti]|uniref:EKC/KEOPS complex subunit BUD32 n=1 Tax=Colletotrichum tanaceti TaxID=1306861 RepID=A0A4V6DGR6_9PEZI|nr:Cell division control protein 15 [Colletotrichum tanaceti]
METDDIHYPPGFSLKDVVGWGNTGLVVLDASSNTIIKTPLDEDYKPLIAREEQIYERFTKKGGHHGILRYHGTFDSGIRLEYASNHHLRTVNNKGVSQNQRLRWAVQIAEAIVFTHAAGVIHGDLSCANIFLDEDFNAKLGDFAG